MKLNGIYKGVLVLGVALTMQSCFVAKDYKKPVVDTDNLYRQDTLSADSTSIGNLSWKEFFQDPILQGTIEKGLKNNIDINLAIQNIVASKAYLAQAKEGNLPVINVGAEYSKQSASKNTPLGSFTSGSRDQFSLSGNLSWEADIWGKIRSNTRANNATYLQSIAAKQFVETQIIATIASNYYQLIALDRQLEITTTTIVNREDSFKTIQALKDAGNVNEVAVQQTEAQLYAAQLIAEDLKNQIAILENATSILIGQKVQAIDRSKSFETLNIPSLTLGVPAVALRNRPDIAAAEYALMSNFELTNVARSSFYPSITLGASAGFQSMEIKDWFSANSFFSSLLGGIAQPILNKRTNRTRLEVARANQESSLLNFQYKVLDAGREVSDALQNYKNESTKITIRDKQVLALKNAADFSDELLNYGMATYLEVLTAKEQSLNSELALILNKYQQQLALIQLYKSLGGGTK
ncbi:MAG: TolC family protein [Flavobacterium sp.]